MSIADKLQTIAENEQKVFDAGKKDEQTQFWEIFQDGGKRNGYSMTFMSKYWNDTNYNPIYTLKNDSGNQMFQQTYVTDTKVPIDISTAGVNHSSLFAYSSRIQTIRKLITAKDKGYTGDFASCSGLKNISFEGEIGRSIDFKSCPLTVESMKDVIEHLYDYATNDPDNANKYTVTFSSACWEALEASGSPSDEIEGCECDTWQNHVISLGWGV